jgi:arylsulfatase A-like enzyme
VTELVSLMDVGPTVLEAAGLPLPTYFEGRSLWPYLREEPVCPHRYVFCEDNYQIMMRSRSHKLVYYVGQEQGELYDLEQDPGELWNLWDEASSAEVKGELLRDLLDWMAGSVYWNAGYKRTRARRTRMRWPKEGEVNLHGPASIENVYREQW